MEGRHILLFEIHCEPLMESLGSSPPYCRLHNLRFVTYLPSAMHHNCTLPHDLGVTTYPPSAVHHTCTLPHDLCVTTLRGEPAQIFVHAVRDLSPEAQWNVAREVEALIRAMSMSYAEGIVNHRTPPWLCLIAARRVASSDIRITFCHTSCPQSKLALPRLLSGSEYARSGPSFGNPSFFA